MNYQGLYWDDWVGYNQTSETMDIFFGMIQHGIKGDFYLYLSKLLNHVYAFRLFVFFAYGAIGYLTYKILLSTKLLNSSESKLIAFVSLIIPLSSSLVSIAIVPFLFPVLLFYIAFYLLTRYYQSPNLFLRLIVLTLFFISFSTNSLLVFYAAVLIYLYFMKYEKDISVKSIKYFFYHHIDFILLPIVYFIYKSLFLVPYGLYENYNHITLIHIPSMLVKTFKVMSVDMFVYLTSNFYILIIALVVSLLVAKTLKVPHEFLKNNKLILFGIGFFLFIVAIFPYIAVSKQPVLESWNSRFSLLLGISLSIIYIVIFAKISEYFSKYKKSVFIFLISFFIVLSIGKNIEVQYKQILDWFYQVSIIENFKKDPVIKNNSSFVCINKLSSELVYERNFSFYELNGLLKKAFGDTKRLMVPVNYINILQHSYKRFRVYKQYNFSMWNRNQGYKIVTIEAFKDLDLKLQVELFKDYLFDYKDFLLLVKELTRVKVSN
jgi:hypothetical protein